VKKTKIYGHVVIPTLSSKPKHHPKQISNELTWKIFHQRIKTKRCAEVIHQELKNDEVVVPPPLQLSEHSIVQVFLRSGAYTNGATLPQTVHIP